ncbi:hypothetical protein Q8F55_005307 [Vanrija albida]|uniref:YCII-related domain-containing protein n=1 Tax=Vanrija albida TaxID=181172 RepID=A0ABR3Q193_9TREE
MPLYLVYAPDPANNLENRLAARKAHFDAFGESIKDGHAVFGQGMVNDSTTTHIGAGERHADYDQVKDLDGSVLLLRYGTIEEAWARVKADPYWTGNVWDKEKVVVRELIAQPTDAGLKMYQ